MYHNNSNNHRHQYQAAFYLAALCFCLLSVTVQSWPTKRCTGKAVNIMFVMDSSSSIWIVDYRKQLKFAQKMVENFDIGQSNSHVRVGAITFSNRAHLEFSLDKHTDIDELQNAIAHIPYRSGQTNTAAALKMLRTEVGPKLKTHTAPFVAVVITDGRSQNSKATRQQAKLLHKLGVHVYVIGVGHNYDLNELKAIASDPDNNVHQVSSYSALEGIAKAFGVKTCQDITTPVPTTPPTTTTTTPIPTTTTPIPTTTTPIPTTTTPIPTTTTPIPTTTTPKPTTTTPQPTTTTTTEPPPTTTTQPPELLQRDSSSSVSFGYDLLSMGAYRANMISQFINTMLPYTGYGNFGVVSYAHCPEGFNIPISSLMNKTAYDASRSMKPKTPGLADVVRQMRKDLNTNTNSNTYSDQAGQKSAVLFVDPSVTNITPEVVKETDQLKQQGSKVFLVNVGHSMWPQPQMFYSMSSQPYNNYIYNVPTYSDLLYRARYSPFQFRGMCNGYHPVY